MARGLLVGLGLLLSAPACLAAPDAAFAKAMHAFESAFHEGRMNEAPALLAAVARSLDQEGVEDRALALYRTLKLCLAAYAYECSGEAFIALTKATQAIHASDSIQKDRKAAYASLGMTATVWLSTAHRDPHLPKYLELLARLAPTPRETFSFVDVNLALARGYYSLADLDQAARFLQRAWLYFLADKSQTQEQFATTFPEFIQLFVLTGQINRAYASMRIAGPVLSNLTNYSAYFAYRLQEAQASLLTNANENETLLATLANLKALTARLQFRPKVRLHLEGEVLASLIITCTIVGSDKCSSDDLTRMKAVHAELLTADGDSSERLRRYAALALVMHYASRQEEPDPLVRKTFSAPPRFDGSLISMEERSVYLSGRFFLNAQTDRDEAYVSITSAAWSEIERLRAFLQRRPFETAPVGAYTRVVFLLASTAIAKRGARSEADQALLLELTTFLNRGPRTVESQYLHLVSSMQTDQERSSLQALHRIEQQLFREEKESLQELAAAVTRPTEKPDFDISRWLAFDDLVSLAQRHRDIAPKAGLVFAARPDSLRRLRDILKPGEVFVSQFVSLLSESVRLCVSTERFLVEGQKIEPADLLAIKRIQLAVSDTSPVETQVSFPFRDAQRMSDILIGADNSCLEQAEHVIFAPDPFLFGFPFAALFDPKLPRRASFSLREANWLGVSRNISVVVDVPQLVASRELRKDSAAVSAFLGVGDPRLTGMTNDGVARQEVATRGLRRSGDRLRGLTELPETAVELRRLQMLFGQSARTLTGEEATELNVRRQFLSDYRILSFATHGLIREEIDGLTEPALLLTPRDGRSRVDDGLLTASEISQLALAADLVILSACNSSSFDLQLFGPEAAGLSSAFFLAGARATIASLWSVDSEATARLMIAFAVEYQARNPRGPSHALRIAMQRFVRQAPSDNWAHPRFWSAFTLFGDGGQHLAKSSENVGVVTPIADQANNDLYGELQAAINGPLGTTLISGYQETNAARVAGQLESWKGGKREWMVRDEKKSFLLPIGIGLSVATVFAWSYEADELLLSMRKYASDGKVLSDFPLPPFREAAVSNVVSLPNDRFVVAIRSFSNNTVRLLLLSSVGQILKSRDLIFSNVGLDVSDVRLFQSSNGFWLTAWGEDTKAPKRLRASEIGVAYACKSRRTDMLRFDDGMENVTAARQVPNLRVANIEPVDLAADLAAITLVDDCNWAVASNAGFAFLNTDGTVYSRMLEGGGFSYEAVRVVPRAQGDAVLVARVRRDIDPFRPLQADPEQYKNPAAVASTLNPGRQTGVAFAVLRADRTLSAPSLHFTGGDFYVNSASVNRNGDLILLGLNNGAQFLGTVGLNVGRAK
jgi:CHAT domain-containing protein